MKHLNHPQQKQFLREEVLNIRKSLSLEEVCRDSLQIYKSIEKLLGNKKSDELFYYPVRREVDMLSLAEKLLKMEQKIFFPIVTGENQMKFVQVRNMQTDFEPGDFGIPQPLPRLHCSDFVENSFIWVPGVVFSTKGERIGHGKGFYDVFLMQHSKLFKVGVCYDFQLRPSLPVEDFDVKMDLLITERRIIPVSYRAQKLVNRSHVV